MADISFNKDDVTLPTAVGVKQRTAGEGIEAGQPVRLDPTDSSQVLLCQATSAAAAEFDGFAIDTAASGQPVRYATDQQIYFGVGVFTQGELYTLSATKGKICPKSDLVSTNYVTYVGGGYSTTTLDCRGHELGVAVP